MELKTYSNEEVCVLDFAAYSRGDRQAGARIQREIDSGTSLKELAHLAEEHRRGMHTPLAQARANGRKASQAEISAAGISLDSDAKQIMRAKGLTYTQAFREAQESAPSTANVYNYGLKLEEPDGEQLKHNAERFAEAPGNDTEQTAVSWIANLATSLKLPDGKIDFAKAAGAVNQYVDKTIRKRAAKEQLDELSRRWPQKSRNEIEAEHRGLATASLTGVYDEAGLRDLLWPQAR